MNEYDDILNRIVEEFYDTGKVVLNEYGKFKNLDEKLANFYGNIKRDYDFIIRQLTSDREFKDIDNIFNRFIRHWTELFNNEQQLSEFLGVNKLNENFIEDVNFLSDNFDELKRIHNKFIEKKDVKWGDNPENLNILQNLLFDVKDLGDDDYVAQFVPKDIIKILGDKVKEIDVELKSHETPVTKEKNRKNQIEQDNNSDLPLLSKDTPIDTDSEKQNLKILQNLLLDKYNQGEDYKRGLEREKEEGVFSDFTEFYVQLLQVDHEMEDTGIVNRRVWHIILGLITQDETNKLNVSGVSDELKNILSFQYGRDINNKQKLNKLNSLELFNNLVNFGVYKIEHQRNDWAIESDLIGMVNKFFVGKDSTGKSVTIIDNLEKELESKNSIINNFKTNWIIRNPKKPLSEFFKSIRIKNKLEEKKKIVKELEKYKKFETIIRRYRGGGENQEKAKQEYLDKRKKTDERTVKGLFGGLKKVFDNAVEVKDYSLDAINSILTKINLTLEKTYERDITQTTKNNKSKKALRTIMDKVDKAMDVEDIQDTLDNVNTKTFQHIKYELSFCECRNDDDEMLRHYFRDCGSSIGNKSKLLPNNKLLKELIDSDSDWEDCVVTLYDEIIRGDGRRIQKHDITSNTQVLLDGDVIINSGSTIEVKRINDSPKVRKSGHILSEFLSLYKNEPDRTKYLIPEKYNKYNKIIEGLVNRLNDDDGGIIIEFDSTSGIFLKDYMFYPKGTYRLEWSTESERAQIKAGEGREEDEKRLSVKFIITGEGYKWVEGNCNIQQNESTDRLDEIIENFFDTGKFVF
jgi:hypothetical protein